MENKINGSNVEVVDFDQELYEKNIKENDYTIEDTYTGQAGKGE